MRIGDCSSDVCSADLGRYIDDIAMPGAVHAAFVRSSRAHSSISIDTAAAKAMPGVLLVLTGEDWAAARLGVLPCVWQIRSSDGSPMREALCEVLARDRVLHVGDTIAVVVAETKAQALDAAEAIDIDYEVLPAIVETRRCLDDDAPVLHPRFGSNLVFDVERGDAAAVADAFEIADHVTELEQLNNSAAPSPMEPRSILASYDPSADRSKIGRAPCRERVCKYVYTT